MEFLNTIFYKSLAALYRLNVNGNGRAKSILIDSIYHGLCIGADGLNMAKLEMALETATGDWLDYWGNFFGVPRFFEETDDPYRIRIIEEIIAPKNTNPAIKEAARRYLNRENPKVNIRAGDVQIFEPWTELLILSERGYLSGMGHLISHDYWNYAVIDVSLPDASLLTPGLIAYLTKFKAGGVSIRFSVAPAWDIADDPIRETRDSNIWKAIHQDRYSRAINVSDGFKLALEEVSPKMTDKEIGGVLSVHGVLSGHRTIFWEGILREHKAELVTGVLRNHLYSSILSIDDYEYLESMTIEEAIALEEESFNGTRENEGRLTMQLDDMEILRTNTNPNLYPPYIGVKVERYHPNDNPFHDETIESLKEKSIEDIISEFQMIEVKI